jgi:FAD/FMN-containing dehydrogenase
VAVRLTPNPPAVSTLLLDFIDPADAAAAVSGIIAAGVVPAAIEMMDRRIVECVEAYVGAGYPTDAGAVLLVEVDGLPGGVAEEVATVERVGRACNARNVRVATDEAERMLLWKGRKTAFGAIARVKPNYYLHDTVVPRTKLLEVLTQVYEIAARYDLIVMNVFHAGDGNLHPLLVYDAREQGVTERVHHAGEEIVRVSLAAGGTLSGEHGIGLEKQPYMRWQFSAADLDAQARLRDAFDPDRVANPDKVLPSGSRCGDLRNLSAAAAAEMLEAGNWV